MPLNRDPSSLVSLLRERAGLQPDDLAFRYTDYEQDWAGITETLSWAQLYQRTLNVAHAVRRHGAVGDRAVILAPQGLAYIVAFLGAMQAGLIAVPLSVPAAGSHEERATAVLADTTPTVILTTSAAAGTVAEYVQRSNPAGAPAIIDIDSLQVADPNAPAIRAGNAPNTAYLQYTSGSTRLPAGVMISHRNLHANFQQLMCAYFEVFPPRDTVVVSWLPFYHDMGLVLGVIAPILGGYRADLTSPIAFLQRPARWIQSMSIDRPVFSAAPNFAFELAARKAKDADLDGVDLGNVLGIISGAERIHPATLDRFCDRFAPYNFRADMLRPSYGLAEATVYVASRTVSGPPDVVYFEPGRLSEGRAERCSAPTGSPLISYGMPKSPLVRIVDPDTRIECPPGTVGEIWVNGHNVADGYWRNPRETAHTFGGMLANPASLKPGTPEGPWLRTGDLGFVSAGAIFIVGRMKDLLIVYGRNHYSEDIESTVQEITGGRVAAISVPVDQTEKLVTIIELKKRGDSDEEALHKLGVVKNDVTAAISKSHGLNVADLVLVSPGSIPTTTSGKIRRAACVEQYRRQQFTRLDER